MWKADLKHDSASERSGLRADPHETGWDLARRTMKLDRQVLRTVRRLRLLDDGMSALVAVSGGRDSVFLLRCLHRLTQTAFPRLTLAVGHFNHLARGRESEQDERFVRALADQLNLPVHVARSDVTAEAHERKRNFEEVARVARYQFLRETAHRIGAGRIATGHTLSDQAETVLMRLIRGAGASGLSSIHPVVDGLIVRPLLEVTRDEVTAACHREQWPFREDRTNLDRTRLRARIRLAIIPLLRELNPRLERALGRAAEAARLDEEYLDEIVSNLMGEAIISRSKEEVTLSATVLGRYPAAMRHRLIREAIRSVRGDGRTIDHERLTHVMRLMTGGSSGRRLNLGQGIDAWRSFDRISILRSPASRRFSEPVPVKENSAVRYGGFEIRITRGALRERVEDLPGEMVQWLDGARLPPRLMLRRRKRGEAYVPAGRRSKKRLKDLMIAARIPTSDRETWPLLADAETDIIVCGPRLPVNRDFASTGEGSNAVAVRWKTVETSLA